MQIKFLKILRLNDNEKNGRTNILDFCKKSVKKKKKKEKRDKKGGKRRKKKK